MSLDSDIEEKIKDADVRALVKMQSAIEGITEAQYHEDQWFNARKSWLTFFEPKDVSGFHKWLCLGFRFKCLNCGCKKFEFIGCWYNPQISQVQQMMTGQNHGIYRCQNCKKIRTAIDD